MRTEKKYVVGNKLTRLVFAPEKGLYSFVCERNRDSWQAVSAPANPLIRGSSFQLQPSKLIEKQDQLVFQGKIRQQPFGGTISLIKNGWFQFEITVRSEIDLTLDHRPYVEPAIMIELPSLSVQREGGLIWEQTLIANPIVDAQGIQATDLPASYYYDPATETEWLFYLDWEALSWATSQNIFGFLGGQCGLHTWLEHHPETPLRRRYFGFRGLNEAYVGNKFPAGEQTFRFFLQFRPAVKPTEWEANHRLISAIGPFVKKNPPLQNDRYSWLDYSRLCLEELADKPHVAQVDFGGKGLGLKAYGEIGDFTSPNPDQRVELMTQTDLLWPLFFWKNLNLPGYNHDFHSRLQQLLPRFYDHRERFLGNWYPLQEELLCQDQETWYFLENGLIKFGWLALLEKDKQLRKIFLSFADRCRELGMKYQYLFPLRYDWRLNKTCGSRQNYISGGLYAYGMILASLISGKKWYLEEATKALETIRRLPLDLLNHEPQQTGFAAAAAYFIFLTEENKEWQEFAWQLIDHQLRMFYWYTDRTVREALGCDTAGMARSFPSKIYPVIKHNPAFKENIEAVLPWLYLIRHEDPPDTLLDFLNLCRQNNFYFFDASQGQDKNISRIPLESLPALPESGHLHQGGGVGHAVYGAGEVLWNALIFEAVGQPDDPRIMTVALHYFDLSRSQSLPRLLIFNPTETVVKTNIKLFAPFQQGDHLLLSHQGGKSVTLKETVSLELQPREHLYIEKK